jgi:hypothetical protein
MKDTRSILMNFISTQGYKRNSPDVNNAFNVIPSNRITMKDVDFPVKGVDNMGNQQVMMPGGEYLFGGDYVIETPMMAPGGEMIRRADGSYSKRGLWDNIRANAGSGKKPTKEMLEQERKLNSKKMGGCMECGGQMQEGGEQMMQQSQAPNITDALGEISMMLENGTSAEDIIGMLVEQGVSEEEAASIVDSASSEVVEDDIEEEDADLDVDDIESAVEEDEEESDDDLFFGDDDSESEMKYGGIKLDPKKKGTFKAQATRMGMSVQDAASHILANKEEYSPAMVKKANFAKNFAKELGGQMYEMAAGGTVPERYKNMGFTKVGVKKQSTRPGKKWMVLAKKGDKYKVVHGGWKGMQDFKQHGSEKRKDRFWDRMGGKDSAKAKDPFSPLYWHKKFGTWAEGGEPQNEGFQALPDAVKAKIMENMKYGGYMEDGGAYDYADYVAGDLRTDKTESRTINSLENNAVNRGLAIANTLGDPRNMVWALPNKGILGKIKGIAGAAAGLSGAALGYKKLFAGPKTTEYVTNAETKESGKLEDVINARRERQNKIMNDWSSPEFYQDSPIDEMNRKNNMLPAIPGFNDGTIPVNRNTDMMAQYGGSMKKYQDAGEVTFRQWFAQNATRADVMQNVGDQAKLEEMWKAETSQQQPVVANTAGPVATTPEVAQSVGNTEVAQTPGGANPPGQTTRTVSRQGDSIGIVAANNALAGLGMVNQVLDAKDYQREYEQRLRETGNTMNRYNPTNAVNPFGNYTLNAGPASNFGLVANTPIQDFGTKMSSARYGGLIPFIPATRSYQEGGEYYADEEEIKRILAMGGEIEFID